jgi:hypothetical protein
MNHICQSCLYFDATFSECGNECSTNNGEHRHWMADACDDWREDDGAEDDDEQGTDRW